MNREFSIAGAGPLALIMLLVLTALMFSLSVYILTIAAPEPTGRYIGGGVAAVVGLLFVWLAVAQSHSRLTIEGDSLRLRVPLYGRRIALADIDPDGIERVDLNDSYEYRLTWRTNGMGLPGYQLGWFRTKGRGKVLAAITGRVLVAVPVGDSYTLLASVERIHDFRQALRQAIEAQGAGRRTDLL